MIGLGCDKNWKNTFMNNCIQVINWWKKPVQENEICNDDNEHIKANRYQNTISVPICPYSVIIDIIPFVIIIIIVLEIPVEVLVCLMKKTSPNIGPNWCARNTLYILYNTLQYSLILCNTLYHSVALCSTLGHSVILCNTLQYSAILCNTLQYYAILCNTL